MGPPPLPEAFNRGELERTRFKGWVLWHELQSDYGQIPSAPGTYVLLLSKQEKPAFTCPGSGGWFKGRNPSVEEDRLDAEWVEAASVVYIGKAANLRNRLRLYGRFGEGHPVAHWGGRLVWQLEDAPDVLVAWHPLTWAETPRPYEQRLLAAFAAIHDGHRSFANLAG